MRLKRYNKKIRSHCVTRCDNYYLEDITYNSVSKFPEDSEIRELISNYRIHKNSKYLKLLTSIFSKYVVTIANNYQHNGLTLSDLISEGMIGLYTAIDNFDLNKTTKFITYSNYVIARSIIDALDVNTNIVWLPKNIRVQNNRNQLKLAQLRLRKAEHSKTDYSTKTEKLQSALVKTVKVPYETALESSDDIFSEDPEIESKLDSVSLGQDLQYILNTILTDIEQKLVIHKFGLFGFPRITSMETLAQNLQITIGEAIHSYRKAINILSQESVKNILIKYLDN